MTLTVAPREISDLVHRVSRCAGCPSGTADLIAENVRFGEVFYGGAIEVFLAAAAAVASGVLDGFVRAPDQILGAEVKRATTLSFAEPVPLAAVGATLWQAAGRGWVATGIDHQTASAGDLISELRFVAADVTNGCSAGVAAHELDRNINGVEVSAAAFNRLYEQAKAFLVAESVLDAAVPD